MSSNKYTAKILQKQMKLQNIRNDNVFSKSLAISVVLFTSLYYYRTIKGQA